MIYRKTKNIVEIFPVKAKNSNVSQTEQFCDNGIFPSEKITIICIITVPDKSVDRCYREQKNSNIELTKLTVQYRYGKP